MALLNSKTYSGMIAILLVAVLFLFTSNTLNAEDKQPSSNKAAATKKILLIGQSPDGHIPATHEFMAGLRVIDKLLKPIAGIETKTVNADDPWTDGPKLLKEADCAVIMVTQGGRWMQSDPARYKAFKEFVAKGGAVVALHWSVGAKDPQYIQGQLKILGGTRGGKQRKYTTVEADLKVVNKKHPIMTGVKDFHVYDEFYYRLDLLKNDPGFQPLLQVRLDEKDETVCWAWNRPDGGRAFGYVGMHFHKNWELPEYRRFITQGILWTLKMPVPEGGVSVDIDPDDLKLQNIEAAIKEWKVEKKKMKKLKRKAKAKLKTKK